MIVFPLWITGKSSLYFLTGPQPLRNLFLSLQLRTDTWNFRKLGYSAVNMEMVLLNILNYRLSSLFSFFQSKLLYIKVHPSTDKTNFDLRRYLRHCLDGEDSRGRLSSSKSLSWNWNFVFASNQGRSRRWFPKMLHGKLSFVWSTIPSGGLAAQPKCPAIRWEWYLVKSEPKLKWMKPLGWHA